MGAIKPKPPQYFINLMQKILEEKRKTQTNDDWRKTCSTEEFAKWIYDLIMHKGNTEWYEDLLDYREDTMDYRADYHLIEMWLKQPHNEKE